MKNTGKKQINNFARRVFSRFPYTDAQLRKHDCFDILAMDTGGRLAHAEIIGSVKDNDIAKAVMNRSALARWRYPIIAWDMYEKTVNAPMERHCWLNRFYFLVSLAKSYFNSGGKKYVHEIFRILRDFSDKHPPPTDILKYYASDPGSATSPRPRQLIWRDMQPAWRAIILCWCHHLIRKADFVKTDDWDLLHKMLLQHGQVLFEINKSAGFKIGNHHTFNALALNYLALLYPILPASSTWYRLGLKILNQHQRREIYSDGGSKEVCPSYGSFIFMHHRDTALLARRNNKTLSPHFMATLEKMYLFMAGMVQPDGRTPPVNNSCELDFSFNRTIAVKLFGWDAKQAAKYRKSAKESVLFPKSQFAVMRSNRRGKSFYLLCDASRHYIGHWHGGKPSIHLWAGGRPMVVDSGICTYDSPDLHTWFRSARAHNTVIVDGREDTERNPKDKWKYKKLANCTIRRWISNEESDFLEVHSDGYKRLSDPVAFRRRILFIKNRYFLIDDHLQGKDPHDFEWLLHFYPTRLMIDKKLKTVHTNYPRTNLLIVPLNSGDIDAVRQEQGKINLANNYKPAPYANFLQRKRRSVDFRFLLIPYTGRRPEIPVDVLNSCAALRLGATTIKEIIQCLKDV